MFVKPARGRKMLSTRVLACLLSVALVVALCPLQGWSEESDPAPDQLTEVVPMTGEPETPQLTKSVPLEKEPEVPQLTKAVPLKASEETEPAKVIFVISEPAAAWPDSTTDDIIVEVPIGERLGGLVPPTPVSSDDSLVFEGWQTEDFETIDEDDLRNRTIEGDAILYAVFSSAPVNGVQRDETEREIASGTFGTCAWTIRGTSTTGTLTINSGTLGSGGPNWLSYSKDITNAVFNQGVKMGVGTWGGLFNSCGNLESVTGLENLDTSQAKKLSSMFFNCQNLAYVDDLSGWDTSNVKSLSGMFYNCQKLESFGDLSKWNVSNVEDMGTMFAMCKGLTSLDLSSWAPKSVTKTTSMFQTCSNLTSLNLSSWKMEKVERMNSMFGGCRKLASLDLSTWDISNVVDLGYMFSDCSSITSLDLSSWNIPNATDIYGLFSGCSNLTSLDLSSFNVSTAQDASYLFEGCSSLASIDLSSWNMSTVTNVSEMFNGCNSLKEIPPSFSFGATTDADGRSDVFTVTSGGPVVTTYTGADENVRNYDWPSANRALAGTPLKGSVSVSWKAEDGKQTLTPTVTLDKTCSNATSVFKWYCGTSATDPNPTYISTGATYTTSSEDVGKYVICKMTDGLGAYTGALTAVGFGPVKSTFTATVELSGTTKVGSKLAAKVNGPSSGTVPFTYKWYRSPTNANASSATLISGATSSSYKLQDADQGMYVSCEVSVTDATVWVGSVRSGWSDCVFKDFTATVTVDGDEHTDSTLTASVSDSNAGNEALSYQWYRSAISSGLGTAISGATSSTYLQTADDRNQYLSCAVSVKNTTAWTGTARSAWYGPSTTWFTASISIKGTAVVGQTLTATVLDANASYSYKWQRADSGNSTWYDIANAANGTYKLDQGDFGKIVRCVLVPSVDGYVGDIASNATAAVKGMLAGTVSVTGHPYANQKLTASVKDLSQGASASYKWYVATDAGTGKTQIAGATAAELDLSQLAQTQVVGKYVVCEAYDSSGAYAGAVSAAVGPIGIAWGTSGPNPGGCVWTIDAAGALNIAPAANDQGKLSELSWNSVPWSSYAAQVTSARVSSGVKTGTSLSSMFGSCSKMTEVDLSGLEALDATNLSSMFSACSSLATVKGLDVLKVTKPTNLGSMFSGCSKLAALDLSGFAAGTAADLSAMFWGCSQLSDLKLPVGFVGEKCSTVVNMFYGCNALATIPSTFGFGSNKSIQTAGCFTVTGTDPLATTYLGDDLNVATYDWQGSNRTLVSWKLSGEATIAGGDDPIADNKLVASVKFTGPAAGLEEGTAYQWCTASSVDDANPQPIDGATGATYSPRKADVGKFLVCLVSAPKDSGAQGTLRVATSKAVRAPQVWATVPSRTQVYVDSEGHASVPTTSAYALGALDSEGKATEGDIQLVGVTLTLGDASYPGGSWTLGTPGDDKTKASTFIENKAFATPGTTCTVADAPAIAPGSKLPLEWEASFSDVGPKLASLLTAADGEGARYGQVEFKVAWKPRA